jgi:hypothetical protein
MLASGNTQGSSSAGSGAAGRARRNKPLAYLISSCVFSEAVLSVPGRVGGLLRRPNRISEHKSGQVILVLGIGVRNIGFRFL